MLKLFENIVGVQFFNHIKTRKSFCLKVILRTRTHTTGQTALCGPLQWSLVS